MKKSVVFMSVLFAGAAVFLSSCSSVKKSAAKTSQNQIKDSFSREEMPFPFGDDVSARFTGTVYLKNMIQKDDVYNFPVTNTITFAPGSRSAWHVHGGMEILVVGGKGYYQEKGKKAQIIRKGDVVHIPAGASHWHGAAEDSWFQQIVVYDADWKNPVPGNAHSETVDDDYYKALSLPENSEDYAGRKITAADKFTFGNGNPFSSGNFSGNVWLSGVLDFPNEAGAPGVHNVVFDKGCYNSWHSHAGGQVLIVTDGVGYHQVKGGEIQVLHPGDVAFCPPGATHWHGAAPDSTFAHLAANTNPGKKGVVWGARLSAEEYKKLPKN